ELPHLLNTVYGTDVPDSDPNTDGIQRADLIQVFLTGVPTLNQPADVKPSEELRLNMAIRPCSPACPSLGAIAGDMAGLPSRRRPPAVSPPEARGGDGRRTGWPGRRRSRSSRPRCSSPAASESPGT